MHSYPTTILENVQYSTSELGQWLINLDADEWYQMLEAAEFPAEAVSLEDVFMNFVWHVTGYTINDERTLVVQIVPCTGPDTDDTFTISFDLMKLIKHLKGNQ